MSFIYLGNGSNLAQNFDAINADVVHQVQICTKLSVEFKLKERMSKALLKSKVWHFNKKKFGETEIFVCRIFNLTKVYYIQTFAVTKILIYNLYFITPTYIIIPNVP